MYVLEWSLNNLWIKGEKDQSFKETSKTFYIDKTINRIEKFYKNNNLEDSLDNINGYNVPSVKEMLKEIDLNWLCTDTPYKFHGDYILDNIILEDNYNFKLIDWRQDFGGEIKKGDIYYDLAKLNHNLLFNHEIINQGHYKLETINNKIRCDVFRSDILTNCREKLHSFIKNKGFDLKKVKLLTAIIWLNMSPLHGPKLGRVLYYLGKLNLSKVIKNVS